MFVDVGMNDFKSRTSISHSDLFHSCADVEVVTSLRTLTEIKSLLVMPFDYLKQLLGSVTLVGNEHEHPYEHVKIDTVRMDPKQLKIPQTFVQRDKYQALLEDFSQVFHGFLTTKGMAKCTALIAHGKTTDGRPAIAHYVPPIVEKWGEMCLVDGMHRNFVVMQVGTTIETVVVEGVCSAFPCAPQKWSRVKVVTEKPPKDERFFELNESLFRDLKWVGIDG